MIDKRELVINKGEEFKLSVREKIEKTDIFYDQYIAAAKMLDDIVPEERIWKTGMRKSMTYGVKRNMKIM